MPRCDYEYKGIRTAINGLTNWLYDNYPLDINHNKAYDFYLNLIVKYGQENIPRFKRRGHLPVEAEYVAKKIAWNKKFNHFIEWVQKQTK